MSFLCSFWFGGHLAEKKGGREGGGGAGCFAYCVLALRFVTVFVCFDNNGI